MQDFGEVSRIAAGAIGVPGQRTFWIGVWSSRGVARLWLEKQQLQALGLAIDEVVEQLVARGGKAAEAAGEPPAVEPPPRADLEFKIGRIALGYEDRVRQFLVVVHDAETDPEGPPTFTCRVPILEAHRFGRQAAAVVVAGRPVCPLCGGPIGSEGHVCPRSNGHFPLV